MKYITINFIALISLFTLPAYACTCEHQHTENKNSNEISTKQNITEYLVIENARLNSTIPGVKVTSGYMKLINTSDKNIKFVAAKTDIAEHTEFHHMFMQNGKMLMRAVDYIEIQPNGFFELKPSDYHLMLINLNKNLEPGEQASLTLITDNGKDYEIDMVIN